MDHQESYPFAHQDGSGRCGFRVHPIQEWAVGPRSGSDGCVFCSAKREQRRGTRTLRLSTGSSSLLPFLQYRGAMCRFCMPPGTHLPFANPGDVDTKLFAKVNGRLVQAGLRDRGPQVQLVAVATAFETLKCIALQVDRKGTACRRTGTVNRTRPTLMGARRLGGDKSEKCQNIRHGDLRANRLKIDAGHWSCLQVHGSSDVSSPESFCSSPSSVASDSSSGA